MKTERIKTQKKKRKQGKKTLALLMAGVLMSSNFYGTTAYATAIQTNTTDNMVSQQAVDDTVVYEYENYDIQYVRKPIDNRADNISLTIINKTETIIENWSLRTDMPGMITELYNATLTETDGMKCFKNAEYNQDIMPGGTVEFGFHLQYDTDKVNPSIFEIQSLQSEIEESKVSLEHVKTNEWNGGYVAEIRLTNQGETTIEDWVLIFQTENVITNLWGGSLEMVGEKYCVIKNPSYNQNIEPGETVIIGYQGTDEFHSEFIQGKVSTGENLDQELKELEQESGESSETNETEPSEVSTEETEEAEENHSLEERFKGYVWIDTNLFQKEDEDIYAVTSLVDKLNGRIYKLDEVVTISYKVVDGYGHEILVGDLYGTTSEKSLTDDTDKYNRTVSDGNALLDERVLSDEDKTAEWIEWNIEPFGMVMWENNIIFEIFLNDGTFVEDKYLFFNYEPSNADAIGFNSDDDGDGLTNYAELCYGTDKDDTDTDDDLIWDGYEILLFLTDPVNPDSDSDGIIDGEEDLDGDDLSNADELPYGCNPGIMDSDKDDLTDGEEVHVYGTNPSEPDTDGDGLDDGAEIKLGTDPLIPDSDGDGIVDGQERFEQVTELEFDEECAISEVSVNISCPGLVEDHVDIHDIMGENVMASEMLGLIGDPIRIHSDVEFDSATITFTYDPELLGEDTTEDQLGIFWYDEENGEFVVMEDAVLDKENHTISYVTDHFSTWAVGNHYQWEEFWEIHKSISFNGNAILEPNESFDLMIAIDFSATEAEVKQEKEIAKKLINEMWKGRDRVAIGGYWSQNTIFYTKFVSSKVDALKYVDGFEDWVNEEYERKQFPFKAEGYHRAQANMATYLLTKMAEGAASKKSKVAVLINAGQNEDRPEAMSWATGSTIDKDLKKLNFPVISFSVTTKTNKKLGETLSKYGGFSYDKYSNYKLIRNCAFGSRTKAFLDSDKDGIYDVHEQGGIALPNGKLIYSNPCDSDTDHDGVSDDSEIYVTYGEIKDGKVPVKCLYVSDPSNPDTDGDRLSDYDESIFGAVKSDPLDKDTDDDGFLDGLEIYYGFNPHVGDSDGDNRLDFREYVEGTNPYVYDTSNWEYALEFCAGFLAGDFIADVDSIPMLVGQIFGSFVPFIDVRDVVGNLVNDDPEMAMFSMIGLIPAGGDAVKAIAKFADFALRHAFEVMLPAELLIQISNKSDNIAKMIGRSDEAKSVKVAMAGASGEGLTRPMAEHLNDIVPGEKIKFNPKASLMDDVAEGVGKKEEALERRFNELLNSQKYKIDSGYDCSEIAEDFWLEAGKKGTIYRIEGKNGGKIFQYDYGVKLDFDYHEVYCDGIFIYDPRYTNIPVDKTTYFRKLRELNPDGFDVFEKFMEE